MSGIRLGVAQTATFFGDQEKRNLDNALELIGQAGRLEVDLLLFAENYPGPFTASNRYEVHEAIAAAAREHRVAVAYGTSLEREQAPGTFNIAVVVVDETGATRGVYRRTHPHGPYIYRDSAEWNFEYVAADALPVIEMPWGKLGAVICSEVFLPEVARILALKGAEVCLFPSGLLIDELGYTENWRTLVRARAIENLMYVATTVNLMDRSVGDQFAQSTIEMPPTGSHLSAGIAMIASPERVLAESQEPGIITAELDLERIRWLRATEEELIVPAPYRTIPGHLAWRRPELYGPLAAPGLGD